MASKIEGVHTLRASRARGQNTHHDDEKDEFRGAVLAEVADLERGARRHVAEGALAELELPPGEQDLEAVAVGLLHIVDLRMDGWVSGR